MSTSKPKPMTPGGTTPPKSTFWIAFVRWRDGDEHVEMYRDVASMLNDIRTGQHESDDGRIAQIVEADPKQRYSADITESVRQLSVELAAEAYALDPEIWVAPFITAHPDWDEAVLDYEHEAMANAQHVRQERLGAAQLGVGAA